jgi:hydroxyacylglutathione hydrolase
MNPTARAAFHNRQEFTMALVFEQIVTEGLGDASYLVGDDSAGVAAVVDPLADVDRYLALARRHGLAVTQVLQTHVHEDFASGANALAQRLGGAEIGVGGQDAPQYGYAHRPLRDGDRLAFSKVMLTARHTPGHTPEHVAFLVAGADAPDAPWGVLSGGALLVGSAGRCDLLGPERAEELARALSFAPCAECSWRCQMAWRCTRRTCMARLAARR